jgi:hypothetical protein
VMAAIAVCTAAILAFLPKDETRAP